MAILTKGYWSFTHVASATDKVRLSAEGNQFPFWQQEEEPINPTMTDPSTDMWDHLESDLMKSQQLTEDLLVLCPKPMISGQVFAFVFVRKKNLSLRPLCNLNQLRQTQMIGGKCKSRCVTEPAPLTVEFSASS